MVENSFGILVKQFRVLLTTMEQRQVVRDIVLTCVVLHNMLRSHQGGADRPQFKKTEGENMLSSISPFQDYPNNPRTFI